MECRLCLEMNVQISVLYTFARITFSCVQTKQHKTKFNVFSHFDKFYSGFKNVGGDIRIVYSLRGHYYT